MKYSELKVLIDDYNWDDGCQYEIPLTKVQKYIFLPHKKWDEIQTNLIPLQQLI